MERTSPYTKDPSSPTSRNKHFFLFLSVSSKYILQIDLSVVSWKPHDTKSKTSPYYFIYTFDCYLIYNLLQWCLPLLWSALPSPHFYLNSAFMSLLLYLKYSIIVKFNFTEYNAHNALFSLSGIIFKVSTLNQNNHHSSKKKYRFTVKKISAELAKRISFRS